MKNVSEISIDRSEANLTFVVDRDEPYGDNLIWLNWGIFDSYEEETTAKVNGPNTPYLYNIALLWSDYYDRPLMTYLYTIICVSNLLGMFAAGISILPIIIL